MSDEFEDRLRAVAEELAAENQRRTDEHLERVRIREEQVAKIAVSTREWNDRVPQLVIKAASRANELMRQPGSVHISTFAEVVNPPPEPGPGPQIPGLPALNLVQTNAVPNVARARPGQPEILPNFGSIPRLRLRLGRTDEVNIEYHYYKLGVPARHPIALHEINEKTIQELVFEFVTAGLLGRRTDFQPTTVSNAQLDGAAVHTPTALPDVLETPRSKREAQTDIGKAVLQNKIPIELVASSFLLFIDQKIDALQQQPPNSDESKAAVAKEIADCEDLKRRVEAFLGRTREFSSGKSAEQALVESTTSIEKGLSNWWHRDHIQICNKAFDMSLFSLGMSLCLLAGAGGTLAAILPGVLVGGAPIVDAIKAWAAKK
jgi:hypothetical protein